MLIKTKHKESGKTLFASKPLLVKPVQAYSRPKEGRPWFQTTTSVWRVDELIRRDVRDWKRMMNETGHTGSRTQAMRTDHDSVYTATYSVFPAPLVEWILLRYGPEPGGTILDAFMGGPPRPVVSAIMGYQYTGFEIRQEQIDENKALLGNLGLTATFTLSDGCYLEGATGPYDMGFTCPPYHDLEKYSTNTDDLSNQRSYWEFNAGMALCAEAYYRNLKPGAFMCIVVGPFRNKKTGELIDFPAHTVQNFREAGFYYHQQIVLSKNFGSAAKRAPMAWKGGRKLVPIHEFLLVFRR